MTDSPGASAPLLRRGLRTRPASNAGDTDFAGSPAATGFVARLRGAFAKVTAGNTETAGATATGTATRPVPDGRVERSRGAELGVAMSGSDTSEASATAADWADWADFADFADFVDFTVLDDFVDFVDFVDLLDLLDLLDFANFTVSAVFAVTGGLPAFTDFASAPRSVDVRGFLVRAVETSTCGAGDPDDSPCAVLVRLDFRFDATAAWADGACTDFCTAAAPRDGRAPGLEVFGTRFM